MTGTVLGHLDGRPIPARPAEQRLAALYRGRRSAALPTPGTREARQLRRWVAQVLLTEALLESEARRRGLDPVPGELPDLDALGRVELGSIDTAALESSPLGRAVYLAVTAGVTTPAAEITAALAHRPGRYRRPERRRLRHLLLGDRPADTRAVDAATATVIEVRRGELPAEVENAVFGAEPGAEPVVVRSALGWHLVRLLAVEPPAEPDPERMREGAAAELDPGTRRRHFRGWLDRRRAESITVAAGYEHPADPRQPDHLHQH